MRFSTPLAGALLTLAPAVLAQGNNNNNNNNLPNLSTVQQPDGQGSSAADASARKPTPSPNAQTTDAAKPAATKTDNGFPSMTTDSGGKLSGLPTIGGITIPDIKVPDTAGAPFMQKSNLPDGTVFICVGAILAAFAAAVLLWRTLVAWSLHRSVKRAAVAQNIADMKAMSAMPGKKRGMYNVVGAQSTMSLDHLAGAPIGNSKINKPFASGPGGTPPSKSTNSLFFSPTAGDPAGPGPRDSINRSSTFLPAGFYASGNAAPAGGSPLANVGGSPDSPSLPPSRGTYERSPPSRDSMYNRNSVATFGQPGNTRSGVFDHSAHNSSRTSLNVPGGNAAGGRAPSAYLEDLFENHGNGTRERY